MKIFAFGYRRYVGKDTAARFFIHHIHTFYNLTFQHVGFADYFKDECFRLFGHLGLKSREYYEHHPDEKDLYILGLGRSARDIWIKYSNSIREIYPNVWIDNTFTNLSAQIILVRDLRFQAEVDFLVRNGAVLIRIDRDVTNLNETADSDLQNFTGWDYIIDNNTSKNNLHEQVVAIIEKEVPKCLMIS